MIYLAPAQLVIGRVGYYCGSIHITPKYAWITDNAFKTEFSKQNLTLKFLFWMLSGTNLKENESATAQPVISGRKIYPIVVGIPPLAEQHRIVAKVDELMALCDRLEEEQTASIKTHYTLVDTAMDTLTSAADAREFKSAWQRIAGHFDTLFTTEHSIDRLKQTILQLAVMGKLVPQNPKDEPAGVLLEKIRAEKEKLVKEGKIKAQKPLPEITEEEKPFEVPKGWQWTRLPELGQINPRNEIDDDLRVSFSPMALIPSNYSESISFETKYWGEIKSGFTHFRDNDVLVAKITPCFQNRKSVVAKGLVNGYGAGTTELHVFRGVPNFIFPEYILIFLKSPNFINNGFLCMTGTAGQQRIPKSYIYENPFPLPPFAEQHRIVAKVDELMALCDTLRQSITETQRIQANIAKTIIERTVGQEIYN